MGIIDSYFEQKLVKLPCDDAVKAYVQSVFKQFAVSSTSDLSGESIVLLHIVAKRKMDFSMFQSIGDFSLWSSVFRPRAFDEHEVVYKTIASDSYRMCHMMLNKQWPLFEMLADDFPRIARISRKIVID